MKELVEFLISHESLLFNIAIVSSTIAFTSMFYLPKLLNMLHKLDIKLTDIEKIHEFFISKLVMVTFVSIEDLIILKDSLSESSDIVKKLIEQNIISGKYNLKHQNYQHNPDTSSTTSQDKYPINPKYFK